MPGWEADRRTCRTRGQAARARLCRPLPPAESRSIRLPPLLGAIFAIDLLLRPASGQARSRECPWQAGVLRLRIVTRLQQQPRGRALGIVSPIDFFDLNTPFPVKRTVRSFTGNPANHAGKQAREDSAKPDTPRVYWRNEHRGGHPLPVTRLDPEVTASLGAMLRFFQRHETILRFQAACGASIGRQRRMLPGILARRSRSADSWLCPGLAGRIHPDQVRAGTVLPHGAISRTVWRPWRRGSEHRRAGPRGPSPRRPRA